VVKCIRESLGNYCKNWTKSYFNKPNPCQI